MRYYDLLLREAVLYRGDSAMIDLFTTTKADSFALFGRAIYLTDDPEIAADYTLKGSQNIVFSTPDATSPKDLLTLYFKQKIASAPEYETMKTDLRNDAMKAMYDDPDYNRFVRDYSPEGRSAMRALNDRYTKHYTAAIDGFRAKLLRRLKAEFRKEAPDLRIVRDTTGLYALVHRDRSAYLSRFDVPEDYLAHTLHAERPLPDKVLAAIRALFLNGQPEATTKLDMRDADGNYCTFDQWVRAYKGPGIDYAWRDEGDRVVSGHGANPDFDVIRNGTHFGTGWFYEAANESRFVEAMRGLGYVGFEYDGGKRMGVHVRGGGGRRHRAFAFWNDDEINRFRIGTDHVAATDSEIDPKLPARIRKIAAI